MKKRFANEPNNGINEYYQERIENEIFKGYACHVKMKDVEKPLIVNDSDSFICILNTNYEWLEIYPEDEKYAITVMYDDKKNLIEWYFDIARETGIEKGIPYEDDLYLDIVITPDKKFILLDEEELQEAFNKSEVTKEEINMAYSIVDKIKDEYYENFEKLNNLTINLYNELTSRLEIEKDEGYGSR